MDEIDCEPTAADDIMSQSNLRSSLVGKLHGAKNNVYTE